jgi:peptidoglycan/xylan/chitin deacetylase (PgdA/CDA1 family)
MKWDEIRTMAADPLVTICAHTKGHFAISKLSDERADEEMAGSADRIEQELGRPIHFSFPYGDPGSAGPRDFALAREAGFKTAGRKGMLFGSTGATSRLCPGSPSTANISRSPIRRSICRGRPLPCGTASSTSPEVVSRGAASSG